MKHLQSFGLFEARASRLPSGLTSRQEAFLNRYNRLTRLSVLGTWSVNPKTGLIDVDRDFNCSERGFKSLQGVSFGQVSGDFWCQNNRLTSLEGAPQTVGGNFLCDSNQLTSLAGAPQTVGGSFYCYHNRLMSLDGAPQMVGGNFLCGNNQLTTLVGAPQTVDGSFECSYNQLTTLEGAPHTVGGIFHCESFKIDQGKWNPSGWEEILSTGKVAAQKLMKTLPYSDPAYWLELHRSNRRKFNDIWMGYRQDPEVRKTKIFQEVEAALSGRSLKNLDDLQDLRDFGL